MQLNGKHKHVRCAVAHLPYEFWDQLEAGDELVIYPSDLAYTVALETIQSSYTGLYAFLFKQHLKLELLPSASGHAKVWRIVTAIATK